jgi:hypothetical protein
MERAGLTVLLFAIALTVAAGWAFARALGDSQSEIDLKEET